jgi:S-DNA-T family DNA segregation ATPase FtsK/SpoIIIE
VTTTAQPAPTDLAKGATPATTPLATNSPAATSAARPATGAAPLSPPDAQRAALRDLVALATEAATTEARLDRELKSALTAAAETLDKDAKAIRFRADAELAQAAQSHQSALADIARQHAAALQAVRQVEVPARKRAEAEVEQAKQLVARKIKEAAWLADSDLEVALNTLAVEEKRLTAEVGGQLAHLAGQEKAAVDRATTFGHRPSPDELAAAKVPAPTEPIARGDAATPTEPIAPEGASASGAATAPNEAAAPTEAIAPAVSAVPGLAVAPPPEPVDPDPAATFAARQQAVDKALRHLSGLALPRVFVGATPVLILFLLAAISGGLGWYLGGIAEPHVPTIVGAVGGTLAVAVACGLALRRTARRQVRAAFADTTAALAAARRAAAVRLAQAADARAKAKSRAQHKRESELRYVKEKYTPGATNARRKMEAALQQIDAQAAQGRLEADAARAAALADTAESDRRTTLLLRQALDADLAAAQAAHDRLVADARQAYDAARTELQDRLRDGLATIEAPMAATRSAGNQAPQDWESPDWAAWKPTKAFASAVRFGRLHVDLMKFARASAAAKPAAPVAPADAGDHRDDAFSHMYGSPGGNGNGSAPPAEAGEPAGDATAPEVRLALPPPFDLPATLAFPSRASMLVRADRDGRADAIKVVQMAMARLLVSLPPGRVHFTLLDPVGLGQNFAGFMHLADHDDRLVGGRIWTETEQVDQRMNDLTGHMETIIQKYLRNEFETIDDYNAQAGELAEPYRFLVVCDFPSKFSDESLRRLSSIATSGARCGVYTIVLHDTRQSLPHGSTVLDDLQSHSVTLKQVENRFVWQDEVFEQFPMSFDPPPSELALTKILDKVGKAAKEAARVEVPFDTIAPKPEQFWTQDSALDVHVPVGRSGATRLQQLRLGRGVAQHVLIAGKTGSGKSTLLNALVTNLAMWYSPDQVEFYLVDFKKGVEFKTYATHNLPHARAIAVESDREFGLSVLQKLDAELTRRGELFRAAGVQDLGAYRKSSNPQQIPRTLLIVDEFQEFFSEDDKLAQESSVLLDRLVRQGRAFGIHCLLGSQTIAGAGGLPRSTIGQMAVRIALMTSEADSQLILGDNNSAARLLSRPGEAIYNDQGGLVEGNSPFQVAWLSDERKDGYLARVRQMADTRGVRFPGPIVFEGNAPADLAKNPRLAELISGAAPQPGAPRAYIGEPVAIKEPTFVPMRRQSGSNVLVIGQAEDAALATMTAALISLAAQLPPSAVSEEPSGSATAPELAPSGLSLDLEAPPAPPFTAPRFYVFDATPADSSLAGTFAQVKDALPRHDVRIVECRATEAAINEIAAELTRRREAQELSGPPVYLFVYGLQRYRVLRKGEDDFSFAPSFGADAAPKPADPGKQFAEILKEGPAHGVHVFTWADTATAVDRTLDRGSMKEFDARVLFQMGANDSSNLIDSPAANKLGFHRALVYSEEQGVMEKFRPYAVPTAALLGKLRERFGA